MKEWASTKYGGHIKSAQMACPSFLKDSTILQIIVFKEFKLYSQQSSGNFTFMIVAIPHFVGGEREQSANVFNQMCLQ